MKPNNYSTKDKNHESAFVRTRIGACDIQIATKDDNNILKKGILHSKLISQCWPNQEKILDKIREYQPLTEISIQIYEIEDEIIDKKTFFKNLEVVIRPFRNPARDRDPSPNEDLKKSGELHKHMYSTPS
jgi:hypothetical protein